MTKRPSTGCVFAMLALVVAAQAPSSAQSGTDLSGKWMFVAEQSDSKPTVPRIYNTTGVPAGTDQMDITQTPAAVTVKIGGVTLIYRLDGTDGNISAEGKAGFPIGKATWSGNKLVATLMQEVFSAAKADYVKVPVTEIYTLSNGMLTIERTTTRLDGKTATQKLVYSRAA